MAEDKNLYRIKSVDRQDDWLQVVFNDGETLWVPVSRISPRTGKADWSKISIQRKGAHLVVHVSDGDFPEHEVPWDVLRRLGQDRMTRPAAKVPQR